jgi:hypothetical protein
MKKHKPKTLHRPHTHFINNQYEVLMQQIFGVKNNINYPNEER